LLKLISIFQDDLHTFQIESKPQQLEKTGTERVNPTTNGRIDIEIADKRSDKSQLQWSTVRLQETSPIPEGIYCFV
jgi:hypothetical protein